MMSFRTCQSISGWLVGAFAACLIVVPWGYFMVPLVASGVAAVSIPSVRHRWRYLDHEDALWCLALLAYAALWLWDVRRTGVWPVGEGDQGVGLPLWPILAAGLLIWLRCVGPSPRHWWLGIAAGALAAGGIALFECLVLRYSRASNGMNPIPFGNIALLLGCLSLLAAIWWWARRRRASRRHIQASRGERLALVAVLGGFLASLLSGTRGGWVALPLLLGLCYLAWRWLPVGTVRPAAPWRRFTMIMGLLMLMVVTAVPISGVTSRLERAVEDFQAYQQGEERDGSVGLRLEMWRAGYRLFLERPVTGWGEGRLEAARDDMVARGDLHPGVSVFDQLHSDTIDTAARRGLLGLVVLGLFYGVPLWLFYRRLGHEEVGVRVLAVAGLLIPVAFLEFGLTQSMLRDVRGLSGYMGLSIGCWAVMRREEWIARRCHRRLARAQPLDTGRADG
ncbi:O-antigen ligase family protein [Halomonas sp. THAF12]|uniref:O-antigen ligase family protein n=1 Tax=Halomonas sp. B23F22_10 TaxID=3459515 RepID=UPI00373EBDEF